MNANALRPAQLRGVEDRELGVRMRPHFGNFHGPRESTGVQTINHPPNETLHRWSGLVTRRPSHDASRSHANVPTGPFSPADPLTGYTVVDELTVPLGAVSVPTMRAVSAAIRIALP